MRYLDRRQALRLALERHLPRDDQELAHIRRMQTLLDSVADPFQRDHYTPGHFTASAFVLSKDRSRLLFILHGKLGMWLQPGGHVDDDDTSIVDAALREVREETGVSRADVLEPVFDVDVHRIPARGDAPAHEHFDVRCLLVAADETVTAASDARAVRWMPLDEVGEVHSDASVMRAVAKLRSDCAS